MKLEDKFKVLKSGDGFKIYDMPDITIVWDVGDYPDLRDLYVRGIQYASGHTAGYAVRSAVSVMSFIRQIDLVKQRLEDNSWGTAAFDELISAVEEYRKEWDDYVQKRVASGESDINDIDLFFSLEEEVYIDVGGERYAGKFVDINVVRSMFSSYIEVKLDMIHSLPGDVANGHWSTKLPLWAGMMKVSNFALKKMTPEVKAGLTARGTLFEKLVTGASYVQYSGHITRAGMWGSTTTYRAEGRVMVDPKTFRRIDSDGFSNENRAIGMRTSQGHAVDPDDDEYVDDANAPSVIAMDDRWRTFPYVFGFSFSAKIWGKLTVSKISEIQYREDAFDQLVLDSEEKEIVRSLVEHNEGSFSDIIAGKGGGTIFMLEGPPGQGKTLTAETVAEILHRPLYTISVGELGISPDTLEERLRQILDIATVWNAVLLLDEADIFLESRNDRDILRNAMVGVFLRLLEYHQGVLFLTTNRISNIDQAFLSRISVILRFEEANQKKREKIWRNLLGAAGIEMSGQQIRFLSEHGVNGRQVKNIIRISQTLARARKLERVDYNLIVSVIERTTVNQDIQKRLAA